MRHALVLTTVLLAGCAGLQTTTEVMVPVPVPCVKADDMPQRPGLHAELAWASRPVDVFERTKALMADRLLLLIYAEKLEAVLGACAGQVIE